MLKKEKGSAPLTVHLQHLCAGSQPMGRGSQESTGQGTALGLAPGAQEQSSCFSPLYSKEQILAKKTNSSFLIFNSAASPVFCFLSFLFSLYLSPTGKKYRQGAESKLPGRCRASTVSS